MTRRPRYAVNSPNAPGRSVPGAGKARATSWGEVRKGGEAPLRGNVDQAMRIVEGTARSMGLEMIG